MRTLLVQLGCLTTYAMSTKERLLRLTLAHYRKDGCSERDCHFFGTIAHAKEVATLHSSKGLVLYHQVRSVASYFLRDNFIVY